MSNQDQGNTPICCQDCRLKGDICNPNEDGFTCTIWLRHREGRDEADSNDSSRELESSDCDTEFVVEPTLTDEEFVLLGIRGRECDSWEYLSKRACYKLADEIFSRGKHTSFSPTSLDNGIWNAVKAYWANKIDKLYTETGDLRASICTIKDELQARFDRDLTEEASLKWINHKYGEEEQDSEVIKYREVVCHIYRYVFSSIIKKLELYIAKLDGTVKEVSFKEMLG